jgi:hypothetical protein
MRGEEREMCKKELSASRENMMLWSSFGSEFSPLSRSVSRLLSEESSRLCFVSRDTHTDPTDTSTST